ncbi:MAG: hypothetical protein QME12_02705 [Nanoarchaeota archaeon]|nr:hypothetical protein [Nanoarchaeota archaeon]
MKSLTETILEEPCISLESYSVLYSSSFGSGGRSSFGNAGQLSGDRVSYNGGVIPYGNLTGLGGDVHDTFKIDRYDNIYGGHTTLNIPGYGKLRLPWEND